MESVTDLSSQAVTLSGLFAYWEEDGTIHHKRSLLSFLRIVTGKICPCCLDEMHKVFMNLCSLRGLSDGFCLLQTDAKPQRQRGRNESDREDLTWVLRSRWKEAENALLGLTPVLRAERPKILSRFPLSPILSFFSVLFSSPL